MRKMCEMETTPDCVVEMIRECGERERNQMGRAYASGYEAWAKTKCMLERAKAAEKTMDGLQGDLWDDVKAENEEAVIVELNAMSNKAVELCIMFGTLAAEVNRAAEELAGKG